MATSSAVLEVQIAGHLQRLFDIKNAAPFRFDAFVAALRQLLQDMDQHAAVYDDYFEKDHLLHHDTHVEQLRELLQFLQGTSAPDHASEEVVTSARHHIQALLVHSDGHNPRSEGILNISSQFRNRQKVQSSLRGTQSDAYPHLRAKMLATNRYVSVSLWLGIAVVVYLVIAAVTLALVPANLFVPVAFGLFLFLALMLPFLVWYLPRHSTRHAKATALQMREDSTAQLP